MKNFRVNEDTLRKLNDVETVGEIISTTPSTSSVESSGFRRNAKRKMDDDSNTSMFSEEQCSHCGCRMLRVVDPGRPDRMMVLECMRSNCLASVKLTDLPVGTVIGKEISLTPKSAYNTLARYYPKNRYTPELDSFDQEQHGKRKANVKIFESSARGIFIDVPGQDTKARFVA